MLLFLVRAVGIADAGSVLLSSGVTPRTVAKHMGHSLQALMEIYAKYFEQDDDRLMGALDRAASS